MHLQTIMVFTLLGVAFTSAKAAPKQTACTENDKPCKESRECCGGCCQDNKCVAYSAGCVTATNPCYLHDCPPNKVCYLQNVQCLQSPCQPIPACRSDDSDYDYKDDP